MPENISGLRSSFPLRSFSSDGARSWRAAVCVCRMKSTLLFSVLLFAYLPGPLRAQPSLTIYSGKFAVVRDVVPLELKAGQNQVRYSGATAGVDPSSVILRDPKGKVALGILEQDYLSDPVNQNTLLELYEGQTLGFLIRDAHGGTSVVEGKVIRAGHQGNDGAAVAPLVEYGGKLLFELPGRPLFPALKDDNILKPVLTWKIQSVVPATLDAELAYLTTGLGWEAGYNLVLESGIEKGDMNCWVIIRNHSGKTFEEARIKLMAGEIHRVPAEDAEPFTGVYVGVKAADVPESEVHQKKFSDFHVYNVPRPVTLRDASVKQIEFARAAAIPIRRIYTLDAAPSLYPGQPVLDREWAVDGSGKIASHLEFENTSASNLGFPLPAGVMRVYRKDGAQIEFIGEDRLDHAAEKARVKIALGNAYDLSGSRRRMDYKIDQRAHQLEEAFEIVLKNASKVAVEIMVIEHMSRTASWKITRESAKSISFDSQTVHFQVPVAAESEITLSYAVQYTW